MLNTFKLKMFNLSLGLRANERSRSKTSNVWLMHNIIKCRNTERVSFLCRADLEFSRDGGADFQTFIENFADLFFRSTKMIFRAHPEHYKDPILTHKNSAERKLLNNQVRNPVFGPFLEKFVQKMPHFFGALFPLKLVYIDA